MSVAAAITVVNAVATLYAAKTAVDGIAEGDMTKAVLGGLSAYAAGSGLAAGQAGSAGSTTVAEGAGTGATATATPFNPGDAVTATPFAPASPHMGEAIHPGIMSNASAVASPHAGEAARPSYALSRNPPPTPDEPPGLFDRASKFVDDNKNIMQLGGLALGSGVSAYVDQKNEDRYYDYKRDEVRRANEIPHLRRKYE